jgi:phthiocerol/phenolphthiocerol synthesis type-I polyketide synthase E
MSNRNTTLSIAIIGMAGRFSGSANINEYWSNLSRGIEGISFFTTDELAASRVDRSLYSRPNYVRARGVVPNAEAFDADFFGFSHREAELMDPQHRVFLECAWEAFEDAGYVPDWFAGSIGVFVSAAVSSYYQAALATNVERLATFGNLMALLANDKDFLPTQISYRFNLTGPSVAVGSACSSSLVAVHLASKALLAGDCDMALVGGVAFQYPSKVGYMFETGGIMSPDGHCRPFDDRAFGTTPGGGAGAVVLRRLDDAVAERDHIYAIIKGSAVNNDGRRKVGFTAPSVEGQFDVIRLAHAIADVLPDTITYVEAHGTGTPIGDPIEIHALSKAFKSSSRAGKYCAIGAVKSNIGHTAEAAGVAGVIKTALALQHRQIPPSIYFEHANPQLDLGDTPFYVPTHLEEWKGDSGPLRAGVSSFGIGGTNVHAILEQAPLLGTSPSPHRFAVLTLSARSSDALQCLLQAARTRLQTLSDADLFDAAYTWHVGRKEHAWRWYAICDTVESALSAIHATESGSGARIVKADRQPTVAFVFPESLGNHDTAVAELYEFEPVFREEIQSCLALFGSKTKNDLDKLLCGAAKDRGPFTVEGTVLEDEFTFVVEYALAKMWIHWGLTPATVLGYGVGEYVAGCIAGIFSLPDAVQLVLYRMEVLRSAGRCTSVAVHLAEREIRSQLRNDLTITAIASPEWCVVSGPAGAIEAFGAFIALRGVETISVPPQLWVAEARKSDVRQQFIQSMRLIQFHPTATQYLSGAANGGIASEQITGVEHWAEQLLAPMGQGEAICRLSNSQIDVVVQIGCAPGVVFPLRSEQASSVSKSLRILSPLCVKSESETAEGSLLGCVGELWSLGWRPDWRTFHLGEQRGRVPLPTYPFERKVYDAGEPAKLAATDSSTPGSSPLVETPLSANAENIESSMDSCCSAPDELQLEIQRRVTEIWKELLGVEEIALDDAFLDVGGDSLLLTRLAIRISEVFGVEPPLEGAFEQITIRTLTRMLEDTLLEKLGTQLHDE